MAAEKVPFCDGSVVMVDKRKKTLLNSAGFFTDMDLLYDVPYRYYDMSEKTVLSESCEGKFVCLAGKCLKIGSSVCRNGSVMVKAEMKSEGTAQFFVTMFGGDSIKSMLKPLEGQNCIVAGKARFFGKACYISEPVIFEPERYVRETVKCICRKRKGISAQWMENAKTNILKNLEIKETLPDYIVNGYRLYERKKALKALQHPADRNDLEQALKRQLVEDLLYFACANEKVRRLAGGKSKYVIRTLAKTKKLAESLPYALTGDQKKVLDGILKQMAAGNRVTALVQGDVGCGKSICAFLLMTAAAENGYQSVLMAPTAILAEQHYGELSGYAAAAGIPVVLLTGRLSAAEKKKALSDIKTMDAVMVVGTHAAAGDVEFNRLALAIVDEEHRFGTKIRGALLKSGCHSVNFTATPIPRTVAQTIYAGRELYEIKNAPSGRKPVKTSLAGTLQQALETVKSELAAGNQAYIVCPCITDDGNENDAASGVYSVSKAGSQYLGVEIGTVTGGTKNRRQEKEAEKVMEDFRTGKIRVLCATTVIEVGVNVPDATVMVIVDAYRFGLAQLHQLRGRVGRGKKQGTCILVCDRQVERLSALCSTHDGFLIAQMDYRERGAGNITGIEQSGMNRFVSAAVSHPVYYESLCRAARVMADKGDDAVLMDEMEQRSPKAYADASRITFVKSTRE